MVHASPATTVFLWLNVPCHAPAPGKGVQGTRGVHWAAPRGGVQVGGVHAPAPRILYAPAAGSVDMEAGGVSGQRFTYGCI